MLTEYEHLDLTLPSFKRCSRLFRLEPIGIGTPHVESLTGYIHRLAGAHHVYAATLFRFIILPILEEGQVEIKRPSGRFSSCTPAAINGIGTTAARISTALERLTFCNNLHFLTMLPWKNVTVNLNLIRPGRAWCPDCYQVWHDEGMSLFEPLVWALDPVRVCAVHRCRLEFACPYCGKQAAVLSGKGEPGYCPSCDGWLGRIHSNSGATYVPAQDDSETLALDVARSVGELVAAARPLAESPGAGAVANSLRRCVEEVARGNVTAFSKMVGESSRNVRSWVSGSVIPRLGPLMRLSHRIGVPLQEFLAGKTPGEGLAVGEPPVHAGYKLCERKSDWTQELKLLKAAMVEYPPPSLYEVASRIKSWQAPRKFAERLRHNLPEACSVISSRYAEYRRLQKMNLLRDMLRQALDECPPPSMNQVSKRIAERLGWRRCTVLYRSFPDLCHEIAARYIDYKKQENEESRVRLKEGIRYAVRTLHAQNIYPGRHPVRAFLRLPSDLTEMGRVFLREAKAELGIQ